MVHHLQLTGRHYLLLPKLTSNQMRVLQDRLTKKGLSVKYSHSLSAKSREGALHIEPSGICWSAFDPSDLILPTIPDILACPKEMVTLEQLENIYFNVAGTRDGCFIKMLPRMESSSNWEHLRASGDCGLSPDEQIVARLLIGGTGETCRVVTDFPVDGSIPRIWGRKSYFESKLSGPEASRTLRVVGKKRSRNSYLPRDGILGPDTIFTRGRTMLDGFGELGDWCFFTVKN